MLHGHHGRLVHSLSTRWSANECMKGDIFIYCLRCRTEGWGFLVNNYCAPGVRNQFAISTVFVAHIYLYIHVCIVCMYARGTRPPPSSNRAVGDCLVGELYKMVYSWLTGGIGI